MTHKRRRAALAALLFAPLLELAWWYINRKRPFVPMNLRASCTGEYWDSTYPGLTPSSQTERG